MENIHKEVVEEIHSYKSTTNGTLHRRYTFIFVVK